MGNFDGLIYIFEYCNSNYKYTVGITYICIFIYHLQSKHADCACAVCII